jgi:flagellar export protein FliJ
MKKFLFRLDRVLEYRRMNVDLEKTRLGVLERQMEALVAMRAQLDEDFRRQVSEVAMDPQERLAFGEYAQFLKVELSRLEAQRLRKAAELNEQRDKYVAATQKLEVLERLKSKQFNDWEFAANKEVDDLAMDSFLSRWRA